MTVASDKAHGILGKADLDLSLYGDDEFRIHKLPLTNCKYDGDNYIQVGLKGVASNKNSNRTPTGAGSESVGGESGALNSSMLTLLEDYEKLKREKTSQNSEQLKQIQQLQQRNNKLQTDYENAKIETAL